MYVCMYVCMYVFVCLHVFICICLCLFVFMLLYLHFWDIGCYLSVLHCNLGNILAFNVITQFYYNLCAKSFLNWLRLVIWIVYFCYVPRIGCIYFFWHKFYLIDCLIKDYLHVASILTYKSICGSESSSFT